MEQHHPTSKTRFVGFHSEHRRVTHGFSLPCRWTFPPKANPPIDLENRCKRLTVDRKYCTYSPRNVPFHPGIEHSTYGKLTGRGTQTRAIARGLPGAVLQGHGGEAMSAESGTARVSSGAEGLDSVMSHPPRESCSLPRRCEAPAVPDIKGLANGHRY